MIEFRWEKASGGENGKVTHKEVTDYVFVDGFGHELRQEFKQNAYEGW
jgi:hypothetical protein